MANHKSADKRHRQSLERRARNRHFKGNIKDAVKAFRAAVAAKAPSAELESLYKAAASTLQHVASKGVIKKENAFRKVGRLAKALHVASTPG